jgi:hypothetical protein
MTDESPKEEKKEEVSSSLTSAEIVAYFKKVGAKDTCPICDFAGWYVFTNKEKSVAKIQYEVEGPYLPSIIMICKNCNFIRLHLKRLIEKAVRDSTDGRRADGT